MFLPKMVFMIILVLLGLIADTNGTQCALNSFECLLQKTQLSHFTTLRNVNSRDECAARCCKNNRCIGFGRNEANNDCWLSETLWSVDAPMPLDRHITCQKNGLATGPTASTQPPAEPCSLTSYDCEIDQSQGSRFKVISNVNSRDECAAKCCNNNRCIGFGRDEANNDCWLSETLWSLDAPTSRLRHIACQKKGADTTQASALPYIEVISSTTALPSIEAITSTTVLPTMDSITSATVLPTTDIITSATALPSINAVSSTTALSFTEAINPTTVLLTTEAIAATTALPTTKANTTAAGNHVTLECQESDMTATFNEHLLPGVITNITIIGCNAQSYLVDGNTISTNFTDCVTNITQGDDEITQEAVVAIKLSDSPPNSMIERVSIWYFKLKCLLNRHLNVINTEVVNVGAKEEKFDKPHVTNFSAVVAAMTFYKSDSFLEVADNPLQVTSFEPIYIQIASIHNNEKLKFITEDCFATPTANPRDASRYLFFADKCGIDNTFTEHNANTRNKFSFSIHAFRFIRVKKQVYFHCNLLVCKVESTSDECSQPCTGLKRKRRDVENDGDRFTVNGGAIQYKEKQTCRNTLCPTNTYCVDLFPAVCRCNHGLVLHITKNQCSDKNLFNIYGLHLDMVFKTSYRDTSSIEFIWLATRAEKRLMASYSLDYSIIKGIKVMRVTKGSVVLDLQIMHAENVTIQEAFDSFIGSIYKSKEHDNSLKIKADILPRLQEQEKEIHAGFIVTAVIVSLGFLTSVVMVVFLLANRRQKISFGKRFAINSINADMSTDKSSS